MHREYHPDDMDHVRAHAFGRGGDAAHVPVHDHDHDDHGPLYVLTAILGVLIAADVVFGRLGWVEWQKPWGVSLALVAAILGGSRIVYQAFEGLIRGRIGADVALAQACLAALVIGQPFVAAEVVFIALLGEALEAITYQKAIHAIRGLLDQTPRTARVRREGREVVVPAAHVDLGDIVIVAPGERIAVDGRVIAGRTAVDQAALTGESAPIDKGIGDRVFSGTINQFGAIEIETEKVGDQTTLGQVLKLVAEARVRKSPLERTADKLARYFLPVVEGAAGLTLIAGYLLKWPDVWSRAVAILVVACPCGLVLATPAAVLAATAWMSRRGVIAKGGIAIERLSRCDVFAFDKTGTLTRGEPELASAVVLADFQDQYNEDALIRIAATAERGIGHPLARAIVAAAEARRIAIWDSIEATAEPGAGVRAKSGLGAARTADESKLKDVHDIVIGNRRLLEESGIELDRQVQAGLEAADERGETSLCIAVDGRVIGILGLRDAVRREAHDVIHDLKHLGIKDFAILTGDRASAARVTAKRVHVKTVVAELTPAGKADWIDERKREGRRVAMVGDGINDAPALARSDAGIAIGRFGADLAAEAGDFILLGDPLAVLPGLVALSRATTRVIRQNILIFAFGLNAVAMASASLGILGPVAAAILHQAGSLLVLLNAMRLLLFDDRAGSAAVRGIKRVGAAIRTFDDRFDPGRIGVELVRRKRLIVFAILVFAIGRYATSGWTAIGADEVGLLRVRGRYAGVLPPGLHLRFPEPFERVDAIKPGRLKSVRIGFRSANEDEFTSVNQDALRSTAAGWGSTRRDAAEASGVEEALMMTGDGKLVELTVAAQYRLDERSESLRDYAFGVSTAERSLRSIAESVVRREASRRTLDELLSTEGRGAIERAIAAELALRVEAYRLGVTIVAVAFQDVRPPLAVVDSFRDVARAESRKSLRSIEGLTYRDEKIQDAEGVAATTQARAEAERSARTERSKGSADAFLALVSARAAFPTLTDLRLFWEAMSASMAGKSKVLIDSARADPAARARFFWPAAPALAPAAVGPDNPAIKPKDAAAAIPPQSPR